MAISVERLRIWLVVGAALLVLVIGGFLGYAHYRTHRFLAGLPARLGVNIRRETNGYTYSQSVGGKTVMTLHAAKAVEHKDGKLTLHDVRMVLYGRKQDRNDSISGAEFEYDQATEVIRAVGEVHIDLEAPAGPDAHGKPAGPDATGLEDDGENRRLVHVKTSGLVYLKKLGVAATDQPVEFRFDELTGYARGAEYNSDTGVVILQSEVKAYGIQHGTPAVLTASHAELDRQSQQALLTDAKYTTPGESARGDHAIVHLRSNGSPERIEAEGHVVLAGPTAGSVTAPHADVLLSAAAQAATSRIQTAHLFGGVSYEDIGSLREGKGQAQDARIAFDPAGHPERVVLTGSVHVNERVRAQDAAGSPWSVRDATAGTMTFVLANGSDPRRKVLRDVEAASSAHLSLIANGTGSAAAPSRSELTGDTLTGHFTGEGKSTQLSTVHGSGHTFLRRVSAQGAEQTSSGETLDVTLRPAKRAEAGRRQAGGSSGPGAGTEEIAKATQAGHVVLTNTPTAAPGKASSTSRAMAELAVYDGDADHLTLTGHAQVVDDGSTVSADRIVMQHENGDATAEGTVKANYMQQSPAAQPDPAEPVHVLADHAELRREAQHAIFYGIPGRPARLWQGASQVEAPVLELEQQQRRLTAHGLAGGAGPQVVHAVLAGNAAGKPADSAQTKSIAAGRPSVVRVTSRSMVYRDAARQVDFLDDVKVEDVDGTLHANKATAFLQPAPAPGGGASKIASGTTPETRSGSGITLGGRVERIVAEGKIEMEQPGRRATGEQLIYTAADAMFVLTGTAANPPKLIDEVQGTVTGASLRFHTGDDKVTVAGGGAESPGQRVHTVTRVRQK